MPVVTVQLWEGQSIENKRAMARGITDLLSPYMNNRPDKISIIFHEVPLDCWASGGELSADRPDLQEKLRQGLPPSGSGVEQ